MYIKQFSKALRKAFKEIEDEYDNTVVCGVIDNEFFDPEDLENEDDEDKYEWWFLSRNFKFDFNLGYLDLYFFGESTMEYRYLKKLLFYCKKIEKNADLDEEEEEWFYPFQNFVVRIVEEETDKTGAVIGKKYYGIKNVFIHDSSKSQRFWRPIIALELTDEIEDPLEDV